MGTDIELIILKNDNFSAEKTEEVFKNIFGIFKDLEKKFSRFLPDSELSILNQKRNIKVSETFFEVLEKSLKMAKESGGIFNPLVSVSALGYQKSFEKKDFQKEDLKKINLNFSEIILNKKNLEVELPKNSFLDLGGCVKGFAVDMAVLEMKKFYENFLINAGGDIFANGKFYDEPWVVSVENPENISENIFGIELENQALATSGNYRRKWKIEGENFHHLVSGKNNKNNFSENKSVSVLSDSVMLADMLATTAFLMGENEGQKFLENYDTFGYYT